MTAYYNEIDPYAAQWLRNLIDAGHIAPGDVDERSIADVRPDDLRGYTQCHFFAGIGGWSLALRLAGWPDDRPIWTGSCPCQPFSAAGKGKAADDERHLWPRWFPLIRVLRPAIVFGEQVEAAIGWGWLDAVFADLEAEGYACGAAVLPACGVGAPHIRQRMWFVADATLRGCGEQPSEPAAARSRQDRHADHRGGVGRLANTNGRHASAEGLQRSREHGQQPQDGRVVCLAHADQTGRGEQRGSGLFDRERPAQRNDADGCGSSRMANPKHDGGRPNEPQREANGRETDGRLDRTLGDAAGFRWPRLGNQPAHALPRQASPWASDWLPCTDGKARPVEPGTFPLAHGIPGRVGRLRAYGNAIVPQVAAEFIRAANRLKEAVSERG